MLPKSALINGYCMKFFWGETTYISMIRFKFWEPVYYQNCTNKVGKFLMHPGRFVGFYFNFGDPLTLKVLQCNNDPHKQILVVHIDVVVLLNSSSIGYNLALVPKRDGYLPEVHL